MKKIVLYTLALALIAGCAKPPVEMPLTGEATVTFDVTLPPNSSVKTRAAYADTDVVNVDVLVFDHLGQFIERIKVDQVEGSGATKTFSFRMNFTPQARIFHIVANGRTPAGSTDRINFNDLSSGMSEATAIPRLRMLNTTYLSEANITPIVMWGRAQLSSIEQSVISVSGAKLIRSMAALTIRKADGVNFVFSSAYPYNTPDAGYVAPANHSSSLNVPNTPFVPSDAAMVDYRTFNYSINTATPTIYLFERQNTAADPLSIIIESFVSGYYRVEIPDIDIVRNHRYILNIVKADGNGYSSVAEALANPPANLKVEITDEIDNNFIIIADANHELGASLNYIELQGAPVNEQIDLGSYYSSRNAPGVSISHPAFGGGGLSQQGGTYTLLLQWNGNQKQTGEITVSDGGSLSMKIPVVTKDISGFVAETAYSYVYKICDAANQPWSARVVRNTDRARLSPSATAVNFAADPLWGYSAMESRTHQAAYLHVLKTGSYMTLDYSCIHEGSLRVGRLIINH